MVVSRSRHRSEPCRAAWLRGLTPMIQRNFLLPPIAVAALFASLFCGACLKLPPYQKPTAAVPAAFKEEPPEGWKNAQPADGTLRGKWWEIFNDPALNALEEQVNVSNQNLLAAEAQFRVAKAAVRVARAALSPTVTSSPSVIGSDSSSRVGRTGSTGAIGTYRSE